MLTPEQILSLPDSVRRNIKLARQKKKNRRVSGKKYGKKSSVRHRMLPREDIIKYIKSNDIRTSTKLCELARDDVKCPTVAMVIREFGSWKEAKLLIFGAPDWQKCVSASYFLKCVCEMNLWNLHKYNCARRENPDVIPPLKELVFYWGSFHNLVECAKRKDLKKIIEEYGNAINRNGGKFLTPDELQSRGIRIGEAVRLFDGKDKFDEFMRNFMDGRAL